MKYMQTGGGLYMEPNQRNKIENTDETKIWGRQNWWSWSSDKYKWTNCSTWSRFYGNSIGMDEHSDSKLKTLYLWPFSIAKAATGALCPSLLTM